MGQRVASTDPWPTWPTQICWPTWPVTRDPLTHCHLWCWRPVKMVCNASCTISDRRRWTKGRIVKVRKQVINSIITSEISKFSKTAGRSQVRVATSSCLFVDSVLFITTMSRRSILNYSSERHTHTHTHTIHWDCWRHLTLLRGGQVIVTPKEAWLHQPSPEPVSARPNAQAADGTWYVRNVQRLGVRSTTNSNWLTSRLRFLLWAGQQDLLQWTCDRREDGSFTARCTYSAKRGSANVSCLSVCLSVCNVVLSWPCRFLLPRK